MNLILWKNYETISIIVERNKIRLIKGIMIMCYQVSDNSGWLMMFKT